MQTQLSESSSSYFDQIVIDVVPRRYMKELKRGKVSLRTTDFPSLSYADGSYDPDDIESGLFRNPIAVRVSKSFLLSNHFLLTCSF